MAYLVDKVIEKAHDESVWAVKWAGDCLVSGSLSSTIKVWNGKTLECEKELEGHMWGVASLAYHSPSKLLVSSGLDSVIKVWNLEEGSKPTTIDASPAETWAVALRTCPSEDSNSSAGADAAPAAAGVQLAATTRQGQVLLYDAQQGKQQSSISTTSRFTLGIDFSPDESMLAVSSMDGVVTVIDCNTSKAIHTIEAHAMAVRSVCFSQDSSKLLTASDDKRVNIFDPRSGELVSSLCGHTAWVLSVRGSPDSVHYATAGSDGLVKVWDARKNECVHTFGQHKDQVWAVDWSECGQRLASASDDGSIGIYRCTGK